MEKAMVEGIMEAMVEVMEGIRYWSCGEARVPVAKMSLTVYPG